MAFGEPEQVVVDEYLPVAPAPGTDPDRRYRQAPRDLRRDRGGDSLEHDGEGSGLLELERAVDEVPRLLRRLALGLEAPEHRRRLRGQPDVPHDRDSRLDDRPHARDRRAGALELDRVGARFLDEA